MAHVYFPNHAANAANTHASRRLLQDEQRARKAAALMTRPTTIILVRHGETAWNREGRLQGQQEPGPPLDELGLQQAVVAAEVLQQRHPQVDAVFSSDLLRAVQTAEVVAAAYQLQVQQHKGLRERNMGLLQGLTYTEAPHVQPEAWAALQSDDTSTPLPGGESLDQLRERLTAAVLDVARMYPGGRVVIISHGGALHGLHRAARGYQAKGKVFNCSISVLLAEPDPIDGVDGVQHHSQQQQQGQGQHSHAPLVSAGSKQLSSDPANLSVQVVAEDDDEVAVVWCDALDLCAHCSSSPSSSSAGASALTEGSAGSAAAAPHDAVAASPAAAAAAAAGRHHHLHRKKSSSSGGGGGMKRCGGGRVRGGRLALLSWNDSFALQAAHLQSEKAFGGSSRAG